MRIASLFLWILAPLGLWLAITLFGTPHLVITYRFMDNGARYDPWVARRYIDCTYVGWTGAQTVYAIDENCPWIRFFKAPR